MGNCLLLLQQWVAVVVMAMGSSRRLANLRKLQLVSVQGLNLLDLLVVRLLVDLRAVRLATLGQIWVA